MSNWPAFEFRPLVPPQVVHDKLSGGPVLLLGHWVTDLGYPIQAAISTMVHPRPLSDIRPYPEAQAATSDRPTAPQPQEGQP